MIKNITLPQSDDWIARVKEKARKNMANYDSCAQCVLAAFMEELGIQDTLVIRAAGAMHGGMLSSLTCGIHVAGMMVLGLLMGRDKIEQGLDGLFPITLPAQELMKRLMEKLVSSSCGELTGVDFTDLNQAIEYYSSPEHEKCFDRVGEGAEVIGLFLRELEQSGELFRAVDGDGDPKKPE